MANAGRWKAGANPFLEDDSEDVDDFTFLSRSKPSGPGFSSSRQQNSINQEWEQRRDQLLAERRQLEDRILDKSDSAVRVMYDTEQVGIATAEELAHQGEQLKNVDRRLDNINTNMKTSQKHLNSMKSVFGSIKSYFRGGNNADASRNAGAAAPFVDEEEEEKPVTELEKTLQKVKLDGSNSARQRGPHPGLRIRGVDTSGFAAGFQDDRGDLVAAKPQPSAGYGSRTAEVEQKLDSNLAELDSGLGRLKCLAKGLGKELDDQMELLDGLTDKTDLAEGAIVHQNSQIRRILKK
ncbi:synaptosomal-associated protein 29 [Ixodes scapularis]|uniref:synaptosomal-associated protein 29 n=1 Tax=Ixodes scapularis TaxID=6945 RepID=UPI001161B7BC|nr:synaptosomal-associated protein 29 [Ixodes scapularis]